jgi:AAA+ superfamily predicted ATPase
LTPGAKGKVDIIERLRIKIGARFPVISIGSHEESRTLVSIRSIAQAKEKGVWTWSLSDGLQQIIGEAKRRTKCPNCNTIAEYEVKNRHDEFKCSHCGDVLPDEGSWVFDKTVIEPENYQEPTAALRLIRRWPGKKPVLFVFLGLGQTFVDPAGHIGNVMIARLLKDISNEFPVTAPWHTLVLIDPDVVCPPSLSKEIAVIDWPLPDAKESDQIIDQMSKAGKVKADLSNGTKEKLVRALAGLTYTEQVSVLSEAVVSTNRLDGSAHEFVLSQKAEMIRKSGFMNIMRPASLADAGGLDLVKRARQIALATFTEKAANFGVDRAKQFLFVGLPGSGKSLASAFFAGEDMTLVDVNMGDLKGKYVGDTERNTTRFFQIVVGVAPVCVRMDEFEKIFGNVQNFEGDSGATKGQFGKLLTFMEENTAPVIIIATCNWPDQIAPEMIARFDDVFYFGEPDFQERIEILKIHIAKRKQNPEAFDLDVISKLTQGFVGRDLKRVVVKAMQRCMFEGGRALFHTDLLDYVKPGSPVRVRPLTEIMPARVKAIKDWGELHATSPASSRSALAPAKATETVEAGRKLEME